MASISFIKKLFVHKVTNWLSLSIDKYDFVIYVFKFSPISSILNLRTRGLLARMCQGWSAQKSHSFLRHAPVVKATIFEESLITTA